MIARRLHWVLLSFGVALAGPWACSSSNHGTGGGGSATTTTTTHTTSTGLVTSSGTGSTSNVAQACAQDADCGGMLTCIKPTAKDPVFGGGPAGGYCSASCAADTDCPGTDSVCLKGASGPGTCALSCTIGPKLTFLNDALSVDKCRGRNDVRCQALNSGSAVCLPTCGLDSQCPTGKVCDPRNSVCVDAPTTGLPSGGKCDPMAMTPECAGVCVNFTGGNTSCSTRCVLGGDSMDPTNTPNCGGPKHGLCDYSPTGNGAGDYGFCAPACSKQDECQNPSFWCFPVKGLTGVKNITNGYCFGATACPNGAADCTSAGTACTETKDGPFCLKPDFPLGGAAPADAGTDGGGSDGGGSTDAGDAGDAGDGG